jgi:hypothetical protein
MLKFIILITAAEANMYITLASKYESIKILCLCVHVPERMSYDSDHYRLFISSPCLDIH